MFLHGEEEQEEELWEGKEGMKQRQRLRNWDKSLLREREKIAVEFIVGALKEEEWEEEVEEELGSLRAAELGLVSTCLDHSERRKANIQVGRRGKGPCCWLLCACLKGFCIDC